ncbi:MAG: hypothetical protein HPY66_0939 [Firmicutes bacterium]|nr:hypothetical protein [Bacillota bacterium]MDI6705939.1 hypothetical protein [Bacillota bacterium]
MLTRISKKPICHNISESIKRKPLMVFFILSFAFTWIINLLMVGLLGQEAYTFSLIAGFGPVLSAMFVSSIINIERSGCKLGSWLLAFISTLLIAGSARWISRIWWHHDLSWTVLPGNFVLVFLVAFVVASAFSLNNGIRSLLKPYLN